ncbi:universal stress protein [candidate division WOR-3 bacterium]|nr:universal stress protein [candidate division WOR-3 bacterium]
MYKRLLVYIDPAETRLEELEGFLDLASQLGCRIIALAVLEPEPEKHSAKETELREALEDRAWKFLYEIEDTAFGREIKNSLMVEEGKPEEVIASVVKSYEVDICATFAYKSIDIGSLLNRLVNVPLLLLNQEGQ